MTLPEHVKFHRLLLNWSRRDLIAAMGKPRNSASDILHYENGDSEPRERSRKLIDKTFLREMTLRANGLNEAIKSYTPLASTVD